MDYVVYILLGFLIGVIIGIGIREIIKRNYKSGSLSIIYDDYKEPPYIFLNLDISIDELKKLNIVALEVVLDKREKNKYYNE